MIRNRTFDGPTMPLSIEIDEMKYRQENETFDEKIKRIAGALSDSDEHTLELEDILGEQRFLPAGRVQSAIGSKRITTAYNCFVSGKIDDSMHSIMKRASEAAETMRRGGGIGYDFSTIRPKGDEIKSLQSKSSGPISFMSIFDSVCQTIASSGHRRGAQMGVLRVDHPDIYDFIAAKRNSDKLTGFNISVGITDKFMESLNGNGIDNDIGISDRNDMGKAYGFNLEFEGKVYKTIDARDLWEQIMSSTWDWAEPGVLFIDRIAEMNNLYYCEEIAATNPCGEQPLPPYGACLLGSFNLAKYVTGDAYEPDYANIDGLQMCPDFYSFDYRQFKKDIPHVVRAMDNVIDRTIYPLKEQSDEAKNKRRMGLGISGLANAAELCGYEYASKEFLEFSEGILKILRNGTYAASIELAKEKGPFPLYREEYNKGKFVSKLPYQIRRQLKKYGIRNSHLTSIAPTGTISLVADNISGGIEPTFSHYYERTIQTFEGPRVERVEDYAYSKGVKGKTANEVTVQEHLDVLALCQNYIDSAVSKTCNVGDDITYEEFKDVYLSAWKEDCKGITTFRAAGKRYGILNTVEEPQAEESQVSQMDSQEEEVQACFIDPLTGQKECS